MNQDGVNNPKIVVLGGGTGSFTLLRRLKEFTPNLTAVVNMSDDGGSTGALRDELGVLPPGDARQCLVALSKSPEVRNLFSYRFAEGQLGGHTVGNIILSALEKQHGSFAKAVAVASEILRITGKVVPVTLGDHRLVMDDGEEVIRGENTVKDRPIVNDEARVRLEPAATLNPDAYKAIAEADLVVIAPGNLYGSLLPLFVVGGMAEALGSTKAKIVSVTNLVTKPGQTDGWHVVDYVKQLERYIGEGQIDYVLYNNEPISDELLGKYAAANEFPVATEKDRFAEIGAKSIGARFVARDISAQDPADIAIRRTLIRHDARQVGKHLMQILADSN